MLVRGSGVALVAAALCALPSAALAGTVSSDPDSGWLTFVAGPGERNDVAYDVEETDRLTDAGAPLRAGEHCVVDPLGALCESRLFVLLELGDRGDRAAVDAFFVDARGDEGDDELLIGSFGNLTATGGPGDDSITIFPNGGGTASGDAGDDVLYGREGGSGLAGGEGDDTLIESASYAVMEGGPGSDRLVATGWGFVAVFDGGEGDDVLDDRQLILGADQPAPLNGGGGDDVLVGGGGGLDPDGNPWSIFEQLDAGPGDDRVHAWDGGADRVACGPGRDTAYVDAVDAVAPDCETVRLAPRDALADLAARLSARRPELSNARAVRLLDQALAQVRAARSDGCYLAARLRADAAGAQCLTPLVAAIRRLAQVPVLAYELRQLLAIERDLAVARADEAAGAGAPARRLQRAREDIAAAGGDLGPVDASLRLRRVWQWLDVSV